MEAGVLKYLCQHRRKKSATYKLCLFIYYILKQLRSTTHRFVQAETKEKLVSFLAVNGCPGTTMLDAS